MKVVFAGGGTGGHLYPALAVAQHLRETLDPFDCLFLGSSRGLEKEIVPRCGFRLHLIEGSGFRGLGVMVRLRALWDLLRGVVAATKLLRAYSPDVVLATGGYASLAGGLAAVLLRKPLLIQEQNSIPGFSNRLLSFFATQVHVAFSNCEAKFQHPDRVRLTGNPVRNELLELSSGTESKRSKVPIVLVMGGSRGARSINKAVSDAIPRVADQAEVSWIWQTGELDYPEVGKRWDGKPLVKVSAYLDDIPQAYHQASLLVCRAGAMTLSEITVVGKPAILIPYPGAVDDHQTQNAQLLTNADAGILIPDDRLNGERLATEVLSLLQSPARLEEMSRSSRALGRPGATQDLANALIDICEQSTEEAAYVRAR